MENIALLKERWFKKEVERLAKEGVSKADIARALGIKPQYLNSVLNGSRGLADTFLDNFIEAYSINQFDLLPQATDTNISAMSLRLMDKIEEKDAKIDKLQSELLSAKEELAAFKARYPESPTAHPEGLGSSETAPHARSHPHSPTSEHYYGGSLPPHQENQ